MTSAGLISIRHQVGDEAFVLALGAVGDHDAVVDRQVLLDGGLDRPEFDAVTPDLDHEVHAAQDLQIPVRQEPAFVPGPVHPGLRI